MAPVPLRPLLFFFSSRRRHTRSLRDWSSDVCSSDLSRCRPTHYNNVCTLPNSGIYFAIDGSNGTNGGNGLAGSGCTLASGSVSGGNWVGGLASTGGGGSNGGGAGGGGGGGGGYCSGIGTNCSTDRLGGHGGGGGSGGCAGTGGLGGGAGGYSGGNSGGNGTNGLLTGCSYN